MAEKDESIQILGYSVSGMCLLVHELSLKQLGIGMFGVSEEHTVGERALLDVVRKLISRPYCATYAYETIDFYSATMEYERFINYIEASSESAKSHLSTLIYPLFVYLYLELLRNFGALEAQEFYAEYEDIFYGSEGYEDYLKALQSLSSIRDVENHIYFKKFWSMKYVISIPEDILRELNEFLKKMHSTSLVHLLHLYFHNENTELSVYCSGSCSIAESLSQMNSDVALATTNSHEENCVENKSDLFSPSLCFTVFALEKLEFSAVAINKDETQIAFAFYDSHIFIKNLGSTLTESDETYKLIRYEVSDFDTRLCYEDGGIYALKYLPFKPHQLLLAAYCKVILLNTETCDIIKSFEGVHQVYIWKIDINLSGTFFATASEDCTSCVFSLDLNEEGCIRRFTGHTESVNAVKFHPNGMYVATGSSDSTVKLHNLEDARTVRSFDCDDCEVFSLCFTPDGKYLVSGGSDGYIRIFDIKSNSQICKIGSCEKPEISLGKVTNLCYNDDGTVLVSSCSKGIARIWNMSGSEKSPLELLDQKYFTSKPNLLYYKSRNKTFRFINLANMKKEKKIKNFSGKIQLFTYEETSEEMYDETSEEDGASETSEAD